MTTQAVKVQTHKGPTFRQRMEARGGILPYVLVAPTLLVILVIAIYPMIDAIWLSLLDNPGLAQPAFVGLQNYVQIFKDPIFVGSIGNTLVFTIVSVLLETILGLGVALLINKTFPGRGLVRAAILVPWAFPTVVSAQMWLLMYNDQTGIITSILQGLHVLAPGATLLGTTPGVVIAALITDVWKTTPFMALLLLAGLQLISADLYEAASIDGSTRWQSFWRITLPLLKNSLLIALLFRLLDAVRVFDLFYIFGQNSVQSMGTYSNFHLLGGTASDFAPGVAASVVIFIFALIISAVFVSMLRNMIRDQG